MTSKTMVVILKQSFLTPAKCAPLKANTKSTFSFYCSKSEIERHRLLFYKNCRFPSFLFTLTKIIPEIYFLESGEFCVEFKVIC